MATSPIPPFPGTRESLEREPIGGHDEIRRAPVTEETLGEQTEAQSMRIKSKSVSERTDVRLDRLRESTKTHSYDTKTPELINGINLSDSAEVQQEKLDALRDVSVIMLATAYYSNPDLEKKFDPTNFDNVVFIGNELSGRDIKPAENAALNKLKELNAHGDSAVSKQFRSEWGEIARSAKTIGRDIGLAAEYDPKQPLKPSDKWTVKGFIHKYPKTSAALAIGGAIGGFFAIRGLCRWMFGSGDKQPNQPAAAPSAGTTSEKPSSPWGWVKWAVAGGLALFGLGSILGWDKTLKWIKDTGGSVKDAWEGLFGGNPEYKKNKEMYERMARRINEKQGSTVKPEFLAKLCAETKYNDFKEESVWNKIQETIQEALSGNKMLAGGVAGLAATLGFARFLGPTVGLAAGLGAGVLPTLVAGSPEERDQAHAVRAYLQGPDKQKIIDGMTVNDNTTLGEIIVNLDKELERKQGNSPAGEPKPGEAITTPPGVLAENVEKTVLAHLQDTYKVEIKPEDFRKILKAPYKELMAWKGARSYIEFFREAGRAAGAEAGVATAMTEEEQRLVDAENIMRKFFVDNEAILKFLHLPESLGAGATVGAVLEAIDKEKKLDALKKKDVTGDLAITVLSDDEVEGTGTRDDAAKQLPEATWNTYIEQRKILREMIDSGDYVKNDDAKKLTAAAKDAIKKLERQASGEPDKEKQKNKRELVKKLNVEITNLELAISERSQGMNAYTSAVQHAASVEDLHKAFLNMTEKNKDATNAYVSLEKDLADERQWRSVGVAAVLKGLRVGYIHFATPEVYRAWVKNYYGRFGIPFALIKRISEKLQRPSSGLALLDKQIEEGRMRLGGSLGDDLQKRAKIIDEKTPLPSDADIAKMTDKNQQIAMRRYKSERILLEHDLKLRDLEKEVDTLRHNASLLRKQPAEAASLKNIEGELARKMADLKKMRLERTKWSKQALEHASEDFYLNANPKEGPLKPHEFEQLDDLARRTSEHERELMRSGNDIIEDIRLATEKGDTQEVVRLQKLFNETTGEIPRMQKSAMERFWGFVRKRRDISIEAARAELGEAERKQYRSIFSHFLHWQRKAASKGVAESGASMVRVAGGKLRFFGLAIGGAALAAAVVTRDKKTEILPAVGHAAFDMAPVTGEVSDAYAIYHGREIFTGRKIGNMERWVFRPLFGAVGLASDILLAISLGASTPVSVGVVSLRGAYVADKAAGMAGRAFAEGVAKNAGKEAAEKIGAKVAGEAVEKTAGKALAKGAAREGAEAAGTRRVDALKAVLKRIQTTGIAAGVGLGIGALTMSLVQKDEMDVTPTMDAVIGGPDGKVDELDLDNLSEADQETD